MALLIGAIEWVTLTGWVYIFAGIGITLVALALVVALDTGTDVWGEP